MTSLADIYGDDDTPPLRRGRRLMTVLLSTCWVVLMGTVASLALNYDRREHEASGGS